MILTILSHPDHEGSRRYVMESRADGRNFRIFPGARPCDKRPIRILIAYGYLQETTPGPAGLRVFTISDKGKIGLELDERPVGA